MKKMICIVCPQGCHLTVDEENGFAVTGNNCERGVEYARKEVTNPTRVITSTVRIKGAEIDRLPVKTDRDIPKDKIFQAMELLEGLSVTAPIRLGDVVVPNILGGEANFVATRSLPAVK